MDRLEVYDILYALAAQGGREAALFGGDGPAAHEAYLRSLAGADFPELWFEIPLAGEPWLDFHSLTSYESVAGTRAAYAGHKAAYAGALAWFAAQEPGKVRQLALSYDTRLGDVEHPAVQLLVSRRDENVPRAFLEAAGRPELRAACTSFTRAMPKEWFACYVGVFPGRIATGASPWLRVECIVGKTCQRAYASGSQALRGHLASVGMEAFDERLVASVQELARSPFPLELQFNVGADGLALPALSASVRFRPDEWESADGRAAIGRLAAWLQEQGLADGRCSLLAQTAFAQRIAKSGERVSVSCFPAFVKLRWREGLPADAKAYLMARISRS